MRAVVPTYMRKGCKSNRRDEVRCQPVATHLALGETLGVTQSTPPLMVVDPEMGGGVFVARWA